MIFSSYSMCGDWGLRKAETNISWTSIMSQGLQTLVHITTTVQGCRVRQLSFNVIVICLRPYGQESVHSAVITKREAKLHSTYTTSLTGSQLLLGRECGSQVK